MGAYINPTKQSKESWLVDNGILLAAPPEWDEVLPGHLPVVWRDNGHFTAAGIAYCAEELSRFKVPDDPRPTTWWMVPKVLLHTVSEELSAYIEGNDGL